jgi:hypothetical protein
MGESLGKASKLLDTIERTDWDIIDAAIKLTDERQSVAQSIRSFIVETLQADEHVMSLGPALVEARSKASRLLTQAATSPSRTGVPSPSEKLQPVIQPTITNRVLEAEKRSDLSISALKKIVSDLETKYTGKQLIKFNVSWIVEENGGTR